MPNQRTLRIFISSPSDVRPERLKAEQTIARLGHEFAEYFHIEAMLWEREPLVALRHFQDPENIPQPRGADIVVVVLWSRLGVPLPSEERFRGAVSGRLPVTGTEWEFEDALAGAREQGVPDLLVYRKTAEPEGRGSRDILLERAAQLDLVDDFVGRWFRAEDGKSYIAASHLFADTAEFEEQLYIHLRELLQRRVGGNADEIEIRWHDPPFRGLLSFEYEQAPMFFGRNRARNELRELLAERAASGQAFVLVLGASGSGKSSLVKAGLLPDLALPGMIGRVGLVRHAVMRPSDAGGDPLDALAAAILSAPALPELVGLHYTQERLATLLREASSQVLLPICQGLSAAEAASGLHQGAQGRLALVIDQLEEIFTVEGLGQTAREIFVGVLAVLARSGRVWVIATMRSDFFDRLELLPALAEISEGARYLLLPPDPAEIGQIIRKPAAEAGLRFEVDVARGTALDDQIRDAAVSEQLSSPHAAAAPMGTLPLLSFLLDQLWQRRSNTRRLTFAAYEELGGLKGAIGRRAEEVYQAQPQAVKNELVPLLRALVTMEGGAATSHSAPLSQFPAGSTRRQLLDAFLHPGARLLVAHADLDEAQVRLAHEALLTHWPRARDQIAADARDLDLRSRLEQESWRWRAATTRREKQGRVRPGGLPLVEARDLLVRWRGELPDNVRAFIIASHRAARFRTFRLAAMLAGMATALPVVASLIWAVMVWRGVHQVEAEMTFVPIPAGCFMMGSPDDEAGRDTNEGPLHEVCPRSFQLSPLEVTEAQWRRVMIFPNNPDPSQFTDNDRLPVEHVSWNEAKLFVRLMSSFGRHSYRLPSEAEFEYAARAGTKTSRYWGDNIEDACAYENISDASLKGEYPSAVVANCNDRNAWTAPVGSFKPNPWGLYDMLGNVAEWVEDCYVDQYLQTPFDGSPNRFGPCTSRVVRGGAYLWSLQNVRAANRFPSPPGSRGSNSGFGLRLVRILAP
jgi:formylglycine-generating enzyme required for sulfatase activity